MKNMKLLIGMTLILTCHGVQAQDASLVKEGKLWNFRAENFFGNGYDYQLFIEGDTLIGAEAYKKLYKNGNPAAEYCGALRETRTKESSAVFLVRPGHENDELLYEFKPLLGDKFYHGDVYGYVVDMDEITVRGVKRNRIHLTLGGEGVEWDDADGYWVEGIGSSAGLLTPVDFISWGYSDHLLSVYEDGDVVFTGSDFTPGAVRFLQEGKCWEYEVTNQKYGNHYAYTVKGDTIMDWTYKKVFQSIDGGKPEYYCALRVEEGKVYSVDKAKKPEEYDQPDFETVIYDFKAQVGDIVYTEQKDETTHLLTVESIDEVIVDGQARKRITLRGTSTLKDGSSEDRGTEVWVEGIGGSAGFNVPTNLFDDSGLYAHLIACSEYEKPIFRQEDFLGQHSVPEEWTLAECPAYEYVRYVNLSLQDAIVVKSQGKHLIVSDRESGVPVCLYGTGIDAVEGSELSGTISGVMGECNGLLCLFPTWATDPSTVMTEGQASADIAYESYGAEELQADGFDNVFRIVCVRDARVKRLDDGMFVVGDNNEKLISVNDVFDMLTDQPSAPIDLVGCISSHPHSNANRMLILLKASGSDSDFISIVDMQDHSTEGVYDLQGRLVSRGYVGTGLAPSHPRTPAPSMKKGVYIVGGRKYVVK